MRRNQESKEILNNSDLEGTPCCNIQEVLQRNKINMTTWV